MFSSVLFVRKSIEEAPSELELRLTQISTKLRIVPKLAGGAHLLFPQGGTTLAVRVYTHQCLSDLDAVPGTKHACDLYLNDVMISRTKSGNNETFDYNFDNVRVFRDSFKHSVVIFIMPDSIARQNLSKAASSFQLLQASLAYDGNGKGCAKVCICPDHVSAIETMRNLIDSLSTTKVEKKLQYFRTESRKQLFPSNEIETKIEDILNSEIYSKHVKDRTTTTLQEWGDASNVSEELSVVINYLRSLEKIMIADEECLRSLPILDKTRTAILYFFQGFASDTNQLNHATEDEFHDFVNIQNQKSGVFHTGYNFGNHEGRMNEESNQKRLFYKSEQDISNPQIDHVHGRDQQIIPHSDSRDILPNYAIHNQSYDSSPMYVRGQQHRIVPPTSDSRIRLQARGIAPLRYTPPNFQNRFQSYAAGQLESGYFGAPEMNAHQSQLDASQRTMNTNPFRRYSFE